MKIDIIIPTYKPDGRLLDIIEKLKAQTVAPNRIVLINTGKEYMDEFLEKTGTDPAETGFVVKNVSVSEFDHGETRNEGASGSDADLLLFMTMDARPADDKLIERLSAAFSDPKVASAYARQLAEDNAPLSEKFSRHFNYPSESLVKSAKDKERLGIKTYFCSNACAMYRRKVYEELGRFPVNMIFNEDMVFAHTVIENGYSIAYVADAKVYHSHRYSNMKQFHRNFDLAVSQAMHPEVFESVSSEAEGRSYARTAFSYFLKAKRPLYFIPFAFTCAVRLVGYRLGRKYDRLSRRMVLRCTDNRNFFYRQWSR